MKTLNMQKMPIKFTLATSKEALGQQTDKSALVRKASRVDKPQPSMLQGRTKGPCKDSEILFQLRRPP